MIYKKPIKTVTSYKKNKKQLKKIIKNVTNITIKYKKYLYFVLGSLIVLSTAIYFTNKTFLAEENYINKVFFSKETIAKYEDPYLYKQIKEFLTGKNYFGLKTFSLNNFVNEELKEYYIIEGIDISQYGTNGVLVDIKFIESDFIFYDGRRFFSSKNEKMFQIFSGSKLLEGKTIIILPDYIKSINDFDGFYYQISEKKLFSQFSELVSFIGYSKIKYIKYFPGGSKTIIGIDNGKELIFNNIVNIGNQLEKYFILKTTYQDYDKVKTIDLGSNEDIIIDFIEDSNE